jgi:hypothetical protein
MHRILEDTAEILFVPLPKESTTMPTWVEHILPNAAGTPLQLWLNSVWLPCIEWHVGEVPVLSESCLYC